MHLYGCMICTGSRSNRALDQPDEALLPAIFGSWIPAVLYREELTILSPANLVLVLYARSESFPDGKPKDWIICFSESWIKQMSDRNGVLGPQVNIENHKDIYTGQTKGQQRKGSLGHSVSRAAMRQLPGPTSLPAAPGRCRHSSRLVLACRCLDRPPGPDWATVGEGTSAPPSAGPSAHTAENGF